MNICLLHFICNYNHIFKVLGQQNTKNPKTLKPQKTKLLSTLKYLSVTIGL